MDDKHATVVFRSARAGRFVGYCCLLLLGLLLPALGAAQQLSLHYLTAADGLGNMVITALAQDPGGALWIGTENGLYRHDGETIRRPDGGPAQQINSLVFGRDGSLWVASQSGLYHHIGGKIVPVPAGDAAWSALPGQSLAALPDGGVLVVGLEGKLWRVVASSDSARMEPALPATLEPSLSQALNVRSILVAKDGAWWFGCGSALCRWHEKRLERWGGADGMPQSEWRGLLEAQDGSIWARGMSHVVRRDAGAAHFTNLTPRGLGLGANRHWSPLLEDGAGRVLTPGDAGVFRWQAGQWQHLGERNGLMEDGLRAMLLDRSGDVWLGTSGHGLAHWRGYDNWTSWTARQGLPSDLVWSITDDGAGRVWIGTTRGVVSTDHAGKTMVREAPTLSGQVGSIVADGRGGMWLSTFGGELLHRRSGESWRSMTSGGRTPGGRLLAANGELWVLTGDRGLFSLPLDGSGPGRRREELDDLLTASGRLVLSACREAGSGAIWVGTTGGLLRYDPARGFLRPQVEGLAPGNGVAYLACGAGRVWLRTAVGRQLMRIDLTSSGGLRAELMQPSVLEGRRIFSLMEDHRGWLWAGTDVGLVHWNGKDWRRFDESNGLAGNDCSHNALTEDTQGSIWVGTSLGVTRIDDPGRLKADAPLTLQLAQARLDNVDLVPGRRVHIPWSTQPLELRWEVPLFTNRLAQHTRYRLHGRADAWTDISRGELRYAGLGAGSYSLELVAVNDDLGQSSLPLVLDFQIAPPWWQSPPALAAALMLALLLGYLGYRVRIRWLVRRQSELETLVLERTRMALRLEDAREDERRSLKREIHDELGQYLSALRLGIAIVDAQLTHISAPLQEKTNRLIAVVDSTIAVVRNVVVALRPPALDLGVVAALEWLAAEYSERVGIPCELHVPESDLDMDDKRATAVFRIVQESLTNITRHAHATQVKISLEQKAGYYLLVVQDNGVGFDTALRKEKSFGLLSMRERALMLGGSIELSSVPGQTTIRVQFPLGQSA